MKKIILVGLLALAPALAIAQSTPTRQMDLSNSAIGASKLNLATRIFTGTGTVIVGNNDLIVEINKASAAATAVTLANAIAVGETHIICDGKGDANTNNITVTPATGNISGAATKVISTAGGALRVTWDGTQWIAF